MINLVSGCFEKPFQKKINVSWVEESVRVMAARFQDSLQVL